MGIRYKIIFGTNPYIILWLLKYLRYLKTKD